MSRQVILALAVATFVLPLPEAAAQFMNRPAVSGSNRATSQQRSRQTGGLRWRSLPLRQLPNGVVPIQNKQATPQVIVGQPRINSGQTVIVQGGTRQPVPSAPNKSIDRSRFIRFNGMALLRVPDGVEVPGYDQQYVEAATSQPTDSAIPQENAVIENPSKTQTIYIQSPVDQSTVAIAEQVTEEPTTEEPTQVESTEQVGTDLGVVEYVESDQVSADEQDIESADVFTLEGFDDIDFSSGEEADLELTEIPQGEELKTGTPISEATVVEQTVEQVTDETGETSDAPIWQDVVEQTENWEPYQTQPTDTYADEAIETASDDDIEAGTVVEDTDSVTEASESEDWVDTNDWDADSEEWESDSEAWSTEETETEDIDLTETTEASIVEPSETQVSSSTSSTVDAVVAQDADAAKDTVDQDADVDQDAEHVDPDMESEDWSDEGWSDEEFDADAWDEEGWDETGFVDETADTESSTEGWEQTDFADTEVPPSPELITEEPALDAEEPELATEESVTSDETVAETHAQITTPESTDKPTSDEWGEDTDDWSTDDVDEWSDEEFDAIEDLTGDEDDWSDEEFDADAWNDADLPSEDEFLSGVTELNSDDATVSDAASLEDVSDESWDEALDSIDEESLGSDSLDAGSVDTDSIDSDSPEDADFEDANFEDANFEDADFDEAGLEEELDAFASADWTDDTEWSEPQLEVSDEASTDSVDGTTISTSLTSGNTEVAAGSLDTTVANAKEAATTTAQTEVADDKNETTEATFPWQWCLALAPLALLPIGYFWWKRKIADVSEDYISATATPTRQEPVVGNPPSANAANGAQPAAASQPQPAAVKTSDDLTRLEGITPPVASLLNALGIRSFKKLATAKPEDLRAVMTKGGLQGKVLDPAVWIQQAQFAAQNDWDNLAKWQSMNSHLFLAPGNQPKSTSDGDDLTRIRGIDEHLAKHLASKGIKGYSDLARHTSTNLRVLLSDAGPNYAGIDPHPWPGLASLASRGDWTKLNQLNTALEQGLLESTNSIFETLNRAVRPDQDPLPV